MISREHTLRYKVVPAEHDHGFSVAEGLKMGKLMMPSELPVHCARKDKRKCPPVVFIVRDFNEENLWCLSLMTRLTHCNVLHARTIVLSDSNPKAKQLWAWVDPYKGTMSDYLRSINLRANLSGVKLNITTDGFQNIVRQVIDGIEHLRAHGFYHGNFSFEDTYYSLKGGVITVKLCNFQQHDKIKSRSFYQLKDWHSVGAALGQISEDIKKFNACLPEEKCFYYCQLSDLGHMML